MSPPSVGAPRRDADGTHTSHDARSATADRSSGDDTDVLVVGSGPAGSAVAIRLARAGHHVTMVEKREVPRHKACGDSLSPRAVAELARLDLDPRSLGAHETHGVQFTHGRHARRVPWPDHADVPGYGLVLRRDLLDERLRRLAVDSGATILMGHEATTPIAERGFVRGATMSLPDGSTRDVRARFVVVADGANSRFGRVLGTSRRRKWPYAIATRTYFASPRHDESWIESELGLPGPDGAPIAGYGWVTPMGEGHVNVGVGVLSTHREIKGLNTLKLLDTFAQHASSRWQFDPGDRALKEPTRLRLPLGGSVGPTMGPTFLVVGDAAGSANPFSGDGIEAALFTGRLAADVVDEALTVGNSTTLQRFPTLLADELDRYRKVGRLSARFVGRPTVLRAALRVGTRSDAAMGAALRIATNELRDADRAAGAERAYRVASVVSRFAPSW